MADGLFRRSDEFYWRIDRKFDELEQLLRSLATQRGKSIQSCDGPKEKENRTIFVKIHLVEYLISWEILDQVFSNFGNLEIIEVFDDNAPLHSRIRFQNHNSALKAFDSLNGRCIYDDCCRLELFLGSKSTDGSSDRPSDIEIQSPIEDATQVEEFKELESLTFQGVSSEKFMNQAPVCHLGVSLSEEAIGIRLPISDSMSSNLQRVDDAHKVFDKLTEFGASFYNHVERLEGKIFESPPQELNWDTRDRSFSVNYEFRGNAPSLNLDLPLCGECSWARQCEEHSGISGLFDAQKMYDEMPTRSLNIKYSSTQLEYAQMRSSNRVFDPGDTNPRYSKCYENIFVPLLMNRIGVLALNWTCCTGISNRTIANGESILMPFDRGKSSFVLGFVVLVLDLFCFVVCADSAGAISFPFDRGKIEVGNWVVLSVLPIPVIQAIKDQKFDSFMLSVLPIPVHYAEF